MNHKDIHIDKLQIQWSVGFLSPATSLLYDVFMPYTLTLRKLVKVASDGDSYRGGRGIDL